MGQVFVYSLIIIFITLVLFLKPQILETTNQKVKYNDYCWNNQKDKSLRIFKILMCEYKKHDGFLWVMLDGMAYDQVEYMMNQSKKDSFGFKVKGPDFRQSGAMHHSYFTGTVNRNYLAQTIYEDSILYQINKTDKYLQYYGNTYPVYPLGQSYYDEIDQSREFGVLDKLCPKSKITRGFQNINTYTKNEVQNSTFTEIEDKLTLQEYFREKVGNYFQKFQYKWRNCLEKKFYRRNNEEYKRKQENEIKQMEQQLKREKEKKLDGEFKNQGLNYVQDIQYYYNNSAIYYTARSDYVNHHWGRNSIQGNYFYTVVQEQILSLLNYLRFQSKDQLLIVSSDHGGQYRKGEDNYSNHGFQDENNQATLLIWSSYYSDQEIGQLSKIKYTQVTNLVSQFMKNVNIPLNNQGQNFNFLDEQNNENGNKSDILIFKQFQSEYMYYMQLNEKIIKYDKNFEFVNKFESKMLKFQENLQDFLEESKVFSEEEFQLYIKKKENRNLLDSYFKNKEQRIFIKEQVEKLRKENAILEIQIAQLQLKQVKQYYIILGLAFCSFLVILVHFWVNREILNSQFKQFFWKIKEYNKKNSFKNDSSTQFQEFDEQDSQINEENQIQNQNVYLNQNKNQKLGVKIYNKIKNCFKCLRVNLGAGGALIGVGFFVINLDSISIILNDFENDNFYVLAGYMFIFAKFLVILGLNLKKIQSSLIQTQKQSDYYESVQLKTDIEDFNLNVRQSIEEDVQKNIQQENIQRFTKLLGISIIFNFVAFYLNHHGTTLYLNLDLKQWDKKEQLNYGLYLGILFFFVFFIHRKVKIYDKMKYQKIFNIFIILCMLIYDLQKFDVQKTQKQFILNNFILLGIFYNILIVGYQNFLIKGRNSENYVSFNQNEKIKQEWKQFEFLTFFSIQIILFIFYIGDLVDKSIVLTVVIPLVLLYGKMFQKTFQIQPVQIVSLIFYVQEAMLLFLLFQGNFTLNVNINSGNKTLAPYQDASPLFTTLLFGTNKIQVFVIIFCLVNYIFGQKNIEARQNKEQQNNLNYSNNKKNNSINNNEDKNCQNNNNNCSQQIALLQIRKGYNFIIQLKILMNLVVVFIMSLFVENGIGSEIFMNIFLNTLWYASAYLIYQVLITIIFKAFQKIGQKIRQFEAGCGIQFIQKNYFVIIQAVPAVFMVGGYLGHNYYLYKSFEYIYED